MPGQIPMAGLSSKPTSIFPPSPQTPSKQRYAEYHNGVNEIVDSLRNVDGLSIAARDRLSSPAKNKDLPGAKLYSRIQFLYMKRRVDLMKEITDFRRDLQGHLRSSSAQQRTELLHGRLSDLDWMEKGRVMPSPKRPRPVNSSSKKLNAKLHDAQITNGQLGFMQKKAFDSDQPRFAPDPISRDLALTSANVSFADTVSSSGDSIFSQQHINNTSFTTNHTSFTTNNTSFTTNASFGPVVSGKKSQETNYGSSPSEATLLEIEKTLISPKAKRIEEAAREACPPAKRRCSDDKNITSELKPETNPQLDVKPLDPDYAPQKPESIQHQIKSLPRTGFGTDPYARPPRDTPFSIVVERARVVVHGYLQAGRVDNVCDRKAVEKLLEKKPPETLEILVTRTFPRFHHSPLVTWDARDDLELIFSGAVEWSPVNTGPLFQTKIHPLRVEKDCRLQRHFGWYRLFYVSVPSLTKGLPGHISSRSQRNDINQAFHKWLLAPKAFLGRTWRAFHIQELKKKSGGKRTFDVRRAHRVIFFATDGPGMTTIPIQKFLDWMVPLYRNKFQEVCKAFARFDLMVSTTTQTVVFRADQVRLGKDGLGVEDITSGSEAENDEFLDPSFVRPDYIQDKVWKDEVMTDGCAMISVGAALGICERLGITHRPSAFQARINGAKGMWYVSAPYETSDPKHLDTWIEIRQSQLKVCVRPEDLNDRTCENNKWSFDVVSYSHPLKQSELHRDFLQILEDRGVPREVVKQVIQEGLNAYLDELGDATDDPQLLTLWRHRHFGFEDEREPQDHPGLPPTASSKTQLLLERAGYLPTECPLLADAVSRLAEFHLQDIRGQMRAKCLRSTTVVGVADPYGVLKPGEVYLSLSEPLVDEHSTESFDMFSGKEVLVARHPTLRASDMQKVRCVFRPELAHIKDVVVMSTRGQAPLAAKLQGGDYDGDKFWICADDRLSRYFRNVNVPAQAGIKEFGITKESTKLGNIVPDAEFGTEKHANAWLEKAFKFKLQPDMLGTITNYLYRMSYHENTLWSRSIMASADLHDLIIDAAKNGYSFDEKAFTGYLQNKGFTPPSEVTRQKYSSSLAKMTYNYEEGSNTTLLQVLKKESSEVKIGHSHILDDMLFNTYDPPIRRALTDQGRRLDLSKRLKRDVDLEYPLIQARKMRSLVSERDMEREVVKFTEALRSVVPDWAKAWKIRGYGKEQEREAALRACFEKYHSIQPQDRTNEYWLIRPTQTAPTNWDCFKVAVMAGDMYAKRHKFMFHAAKDTVVYLKSQSANGKRVLDKISRVMKPKKPKDRAAAVEESNEGDEGSDTEEDEPGMEFESFDVP